MRALDAFTPISLDALVETAALMTRVDRKYVLPRASVPALLTALDPQTRVLEIDGSRAFSYRSVYFDTPDLLSFRLAAQPRRRRFKVRTRSYEDTGGAFLEIKTRGARGTTAKDRGEYTAALDELSAEAVSDVAEALTGIGVEAAVATTLQATLVSAYHRATLLTPHGGGRATIDTGLTWEDASGARLSLPDLAIVETKSPARASAVDRELWRHGHRPVSVSKYATGLAALRPHLPRNRWSRLLKGPFQASPGVASGAIAHNRPEEIPCEAAV